MSDTSLPFALYNGVLSRLKHDFDLEELPSGQGSVPYLPIHSQSPVFEGRAGEMRRFRGRGLFQVVTISIVVPTIKLDSHMLFAFTPSSSAIPHFTVDSVHAGDTYAFHLDLIPRVDLGANLHYIEQVYDPLTALYDETSAIDGLSAPKLSPKQRAIMSPWMLAARADESAFKRIETAVDGYYSHWLSLVENNIDVSSLSYESLAERDQLNKALIFNPEIDPVWHQITPLVGREIARQQIETLKLTGDRVSV